jgi:hypothetical protein
MLLRSTTEDAPGAAFTLDANGHSATAAMVDSEAMEQSQQESESRIPSHPLGVKPLGNQFLSGVTSAREHVGTFQILPDEVQSQLLEYLDQRSLRTLGYTCRFLFAFCYSDELWKALFLE